ncbi:MAG: hypothetical protein R8G34_05185 [Paracoccaceae bacterium]|nr:hypothetical protein [Paracoccaceae bacterium]
MDTALAYIWLLPVAIGIFGVYHFAMRDLGAQVLTPRLTAEE